MEAQGYVCVCVVISFFVRLVITCKWLPIFKDWFISWIGNEVWHSLYQFASDNQVRFGCLGPCQSSFILHTRAESDAYTLCFSLYGYSIGGREKCAGQYICVRSYSWRHSSSLLGVIMIVLLILVVKNTQKLWSFNRSFWGVRHVSYVSNGPCPLCEGKSSIGLAQ